MEEVDEKPIEILRSRWLHGKQYVKIRWSDGARTYEKVSSLTGRAKRLY
jgi:hypothetical protein